MYGPSVHGHDGGVEGQGQVLLEAWLGERARILATRLLNRLMEAERDDFIGCAPYARGGGRRGYRNGYETRWLDTSLGRLRLRRPRVRATAEPFRTVVLQAYQRRWRQIEAAVRRWVAGGLSTRAAAAEVTRTFGAIVSATTVSRIVAELDAAIRWFHQRPLGPGRYRYLFLDGKHVWTCHRRRRRGRGRKRKAVILLAWGLRHDGGEELIDFAVAPGEDEASWTTLLTRLEARGVKPAPTKWDTGLEMIITDGDGGLDAARLMVYDGVPHQRCVFHRLKNLAEHVLDRNHLDRMRAEAAAIYRGVDGLPQARARLGRWVTRWIGVEPEAAKWFVDEFDLTLRYLMVPQAWRRRVKTTNPIERLIRELSRQFDSRGICPSEVSWERATYLTWLHIKHGGYAPTRRRAAPPKFTRRS